MVMDLVIADSSILAKLALAVVIGTLVGMVNKPRGNMEGVRSASLVCLSAALLTALSVSVTFLSVVAGGVVIGAAILGAATILHATHASDRIAGLTGASELWALTAVGVTIGAGNYTMAIVTAVFVAVILHVTHVIETAKK